MEDNAKYSDIVAHAKELYEKTTSYWSELYEAARNDMDFMSGEPGAQWDKSDYNDRITSGRPAITLDYLSQAIHQVVNDIRQSTPQIRIIPNSLDADQETAAIINGLIRNIEYASSADDVYDYAVECAVRSSFGFVRVDHEYEDENNNIQRIVLRRVINPLTCFIDKDSINPDGSDAKYAFVEETISKHQFEKKYSDFVPTDFAAQTGNNKSETVRLCEYFCKKEIKKIQFMVPETGQIIETDYDETLPLIEGAQIVKQTVIERYLLSGNDVLEKTIFPGNHIPIIPVIGEEFYVNGERKYLSLIRRSKDAQRMINYWNTLQTEILQKQPTAPIMAAEGQLDQYRTLWANPSKAIYLPYSTTDSSGNQVPPPQRLEPPQISQGALTASLAAVDSLKATLGMYSASFGQSGNEISGVAINQRRSEGDTSTFHFADNLNKSLAQVGRVMLGMIPIIYDTPRLITIINDEDESELVGVNGEIAPEQKALFNITRGKYNVKIVTGQAYSTRREEAAELFQNIITTQPQLMQIMGDLYFKYLDIEGADVMAKRMRKTIDPNLLIDEDDIDPALQALQAQNQQLLAQLQEMQMALAEKQSEQQIKVAEIQQKAQVEQLKAQVDVNKISTDKEIADAEILLKQTELELKKYELAIKEQEIAAQNQVAIITAQNAPRDPATLQAEMLMKQMEIEQEMLENQREEGLQQSILAAQAGLAEQMQRLDETLRNLTKPREIVRDKSGLIKEIR